MQASFQYTMYQKLKQKLKFHFLFEFSIAENCIYLIQVTSFPFFSFNKIVLHFC